MIDMVRFVNQTSMDMDPLKQGVNRLIGGILEKKAQKNAMAGDKNAMVDMAGMNPNKARQIGSILGNDKADQEAFQAKEMELTGKIARSYASATDKSTVLNSAIQSLSTFADSDPVAAEVIKDLQGLQGMPPEQVEAIMGQALSQFGGDQRGEKIQFGAQQTVKDSEGNLFFATQKRDPSTGEVQSVLSPLQQGGADQPVGQISVTGQYGLTAPEKVSHDAAGTVATEQAKFSVEKNLKPQIAAAVKVAEQQAKEKGEILTSLNRAKAALPGLTEVVDRLKELAPIATSTRMGNAYDFTAKELGFGSTKGSNAKAKFIATVNNQVLPLLKQTFGSAFTVAESQELKATLGDPDASPGQKMAQLDAFIESKLREIETKEREVQSMGQEPAPAKDFDLEFDPATGTFK